MDREIVENYGEIMKQKKVNKMRKDPLGDAIKNLYTDETKDIALEQLEIETQNE